MTAKSSLWFPKLTAQIGAGLSALTCMTLPFSNIGYAQVNPVPVTMVVEKIKYEINQARQETGQQEPKLSITSVDIFLSAVASDEKGVGFKLEIPVVSDLISQLPALDAIKKSNISNIQTISIKLKPEGGQILVERQEQETGDLGLTSAIESVKAGLRLAAQKEEDGLAFELEESSFESEFIIGKTEGGGVKILFLDKAEVNYRELLTQRVVVHFELAPKS